MGYKVNKIRVGTKQVRPAFQLKKIFDFSTDTSFGDYTYKKRVGNGLIIYNGYVSGNGSTSSYGDGTVYKTINAKKFHGRIKFLFKNTSRGTNQGGGVTISPWDTVVVSGTVSGHIEVSQNVKKLVLYNISGNYYKKEGINISLGQQYYLDFEFDNGLCKVSLLDTSLNVIDSLSQNSSMSTIPYSGFSGWEHSSTPGFFRIYEYREAYEA